LPGKNETQPDKGCVFLLSIKTIVPARRHFEGKKER